MPELWECLATRKGEGKVNTVVLSVKGRGRHEVQLQDIEVPDAWHVAMRLKGQDREVVLECWHLCHDLLANLRGNTIPSQI